MNLTDTELTQPKATTCEHEWNNQCDAIKRVRNGEYPPDWFQRMMLSGLMSRIMASWGAEKSLAE